MIIFDVLNLIIQESTTQVDGSYVGVVVVEKEDNNIFGVGVFIEESPMFLLWGNCFYSRGCL
jgi:hypothetical protein